MPKLSTITQGCSKKKVVNIKELRPFIGWGDLVRKMQISKHLSADMLNETTKLLRMRDTVNKLMDKVEGIFSLKHESSIFRSFIQTCMWFWKCQASSPQAKQYRV